MKEFTLSKWTLITGASSGIGEELAKLYAEQGDDLFLVARDSEKLQNLKTELEEKHGITCDFLSLDLSELGAAKKVYEQATKDKNQIGTLVNNAGFGDYGDFDEQSWKKLESMMLLNMVTLTHLTHLVLPSMKSSNYGRILNVASVAAFLPGPCMAVYYATKAYVLSFSQGISEELSDTNVSVTALCPGPTATNFGKEADAENSKLFKNTEKLMTAREVAVFGADALANKKTVAIPGAKNKFLTQVVPKILPRSAQAKAVRRAQN